jgi:hypothetical protein
VFAEPALEGYIFYLRQVEGESSAAALAHRAVFERDLGALCKHMRALSGQPIPAWEWPPVSPARIPSQIILHSGWLENPASGRCCLVSAGLYGDSYWIQSAYAQRGPAGLALFARLRDEAWHPAPSEHLLGESALLCGIVAPETGPAGGEAQISLERETAGRLLEIYLGGPPVALHASRPADGRAGFLYGGSPDHPYVTALLYPDEASEAWVGEHITTNVTLRLELYKHKADRQLSWCETRLPLMTGQAQFLRGLLDEIHALLPAKATPANLQRLQELVRLYRLFNGNLGMLTDRHVTAGINLHNLDVVLAELQPLAEDSLLGGLRSRLRGRYDQLESDFSRADQPRQQAERVIDALKVELALDRLLDPGPADGGPGLIDRGGFPGAQPLLESDILLPEIEMRPPVELNDQARALLQQIYLGYKQVRVEQEFRRGYGGSRIFLTLPITARNRKAALTVTKFGLAHELRAERDNYEHFVEPHLPFCVAPLRGGRYYEFGSQAVLNYAYVGDGVLGHTTDLESWSRQVAPARTAPSAVALLDDLLDQELGQHWYAQTASHELFFAEEYGQHLAEHLCLRLRPGRPDQIWRLDQPAQPDAAYTRIDLGDLPAAHESLSAGQQVSIDGLEILRIKRDQIKLRDPAGRGIFVRVKFPPEDDAVQRLEVGDRVGVRGELLYNRRERLEQIARSAFPHLAPAISSPGIALPGAPGTLPNPLQLYPRLLEVRLADRPYAYVHGDLHLRNVLVDERGLGWLIDFARTGERHNLFDFIKLETYVRLMCLGGEQAAGGFSMREYVRFEDALTVSSLAGAAKNPLRPKWPALWRWRADPQLAAAGDMIRAIRRIARKYMAADPGFLGEYMPALFLYCLAVTKYYDAGSPQPTRLAFTTAAVLGRYLMMPPKKEKP